jgi:hypothetical protein
MAEYQGLANTLGRVRLRVMPELVEDINTIQLEYHQQIEEALSGIRMSQYQALAESINFAEFYGSSLLASAVATEQDTYETETFGGGFSSETDRRMAETVNEVGRAAKGEISKEEGLAAVSENFRYLNEKLDDIQGKVDSIEENQNELFERQNRMFQIRRIRLYIMITTWLIRFLIEPVK